MVSRATAAGGAGVRGRDKTTRMLPYHSAATPRMSKALPQPPGFRHGVKATLAPTRANSPCGNTPHRYTCLIQIRGV